MTAIQKRTVKVYLVNFRGCSTRAGFFARLARCFGLGASVIWNGSAWRELCRRLSEISNSGYSTRIQLHGLEEVYPRLKNECEALIRILRAAGESAGDLRADAVIGDAKWKI